MNYQHDGKEDFSTNKEQQMKTENLRPIVTKFYGDRKAHNVLRTNRASKANMAVLHCIKHMQVNEYGAVLAEVYDERTGTLHAVVTMSYVGKIVIVYKRKVKEGM